MATEGAAAKRTVVRCRSCGYATVPVSGFCPRCLAALPRGAPIPWLIPAALVAVLALAALYLATGRFTSTLRPPVALSTTSPSTTGSAPASLPPRPSAPPPTASTVTSPTPTPSTVASLPPSASASAAASGTAPVPNASPARPTTSPRAPIVIGVVPSTDTWSDGTWAPDREAAFLVSCVAERGEHATSFCVRSLYREERRGPR